MQQTLRVGIVVIGLNFGPYINTAFTMKTFSHYWDHVKFILNQMLEEWEVSLNVPVGCWTPGSWEIARWFPQQAWASVGHVGQPQFIRKWVTWPIGKLFMYILPLAPWFISDVHFCQNAPTHKKGVQADNNRDSKWSKVALELDQILLVADFECWMNHSDLYGGRSSTRSASGQNRVTIQ